MATGFTPTFVGAGAGARAGAVPNPGADTPADYVLRADATWGPDSGAAYQDGIVLFTVTGPNAMATAAVPFSPVYGAPPQVLCSSSNDELIGTAYGITTGGFVAQMTAATPVVNDTSGTFTYLAL